MSEHPVRAAIAAERERNGEAKLELLERANRLHEEIEELEEKIAELDKQFEGLDAADEAILLTMGQNKAQDSGRPEPSSLTPRPAAPEPAPPPAKKETPAPKPFAKRAVDPSTGGRAAKQVARQDAVLAVLRENKAELSSTEVGRAVGLSESQAKTALGNLEALGKVKRTGKGRWTRWSLGEETRTPVSQGPGEREKGSEGAEKHGSLEGRIMQACMLEPKTMESLAGDFKDAGYSAIQAAVGKLVREGELRSRHKGGKVVYAFVG